jgi:hypothetical protein
MSSAALSARELTRRLVARSFAPSDAPDGAAIAIHAACELACRQLTRSLGPAGASALLVRALAQARLTHPILTEIRVGHHSDPTLDGVDAIIRTHGAPAVVAGLDSMLETLFDLLGRLIGDDMVARLVEQGAPVETQVEKEAK